MGDFECAGEIADSQGQLRESNSTRGGGDAAMVAVEPVVDDEAEEIGLFSGCRVFVSRNWTGAAGQCRLKHFWKEAVCRVLFPLPGPGTWRGR